MPISMREISVEMDPCPSPTRQRISLTTLARQHRWVLPGPAQFNLRQLAQRHLHPKKRGLRFLWYNTYLVNGFNLTDALPPPFKNTLPNIEVKAGPARSARAAEIGVAIRNSGYHVAAFCEVYEAHTRNKILAAWSGKPPIVAEGPPGRTLTLGYALLKQLSEQWGGAPSDVVGALNEIVEGFDSVANRVTFGLWSRVKRSAAPTVDINSSGLLTLVDGLPTGGSDRVVYGEQGDIFRDADAWSNKGVLLLYIDTGFRHADGTPVYIELYSTHLFSGGELLWDPDDATRAKIQTSQLIDLVNFVTTRRSRRNIVIVAGDFNIYGDTSFYDVLRKYMEGGLGLQDIWARHAVDRYGAKIGRTNNPECQAGVDCNQLYCDDFDATAVSHGGRIDYVFVERPDPQHSLMVDIARPRRRHFKRNASAEDFDEQPHMSDHLGLELELILTPMEHVPASPKPKP
jgi:hypothetical protein